MKTIAALWPLLLLIQTATADWPSFLGPHHNNSLPEESCLTTFPKEGPTVVWARDVHPGYGGSAIVGKEVFNLDRVNQEKDVLSCINLDTGKTLWTWTYEVAGRFPHPGSRGVPTVTADTVILSGSFGHVYCLDRKTHKERWIVDIAKTFNTMPPRFGYSIHPLLHGDTCIVAPTSDTAGLAALDIKTGKTVWTSEPFGSSHSSPVKITLLGQEMIIMPGLKGDQELNIIGCHPDTGKTLFKYTENIGASRFRSIPNLTALTDSTALFTAGYAKGSRILSFKKENGTIIASKIKQLPFGAKFHRPVRIKDTLYLTADHDPRRSRKKNKKLPGLIACDLNGEIQWQTGPDLDFTGGSLIQVGNTILSQDGKDGTLRLIKPGSKYQELASAKVFTKPTGKELWAPLSFSSGKLIIRSQNQLLCLDLSPK